MTTPKVQAKQLINIEALTAEHPTDRVRLHITPFSEALLKTFVPPAIQPLATNISYHKLETFPEKGFGYVELPKMEAQKLKKKFNGSILKGSKVRVEEARPEKKRKAESQDDAAEEEPRKHKRKIKKEKGELVGITLPDDRSVKRGWTEQPTSQSKDKKDKKEKSSSKRDKSKREVSKYTAEPECLFRTEVPPNIASKADEKKKKKKKKGEKGTVVHEFEQTQKHASFLKSGKVDKDAKVVSEFVEGKGWVDGEGNVVEAESQDQREKRERKEEKRARKARKEEERQALLAAVPDIEEESEKRESSVEDEGDGEASVETTAKPEHGDEPTSPDPSSTLETSENTTEEPPKAIHPLEALYKRPKPTSADSPTKPAPINTSFNFFGNNNAADEDEDERETTPNGIDDTIMTDHLPQTPFTQQDIEWRGTRSAAPTPDTAVINKRFSFPMMKIDEHEESAEGEGNVDEEGDISGLGIVGANADEEVGVKVAQKGEKEESEFAKWFWENRGDNNRAWKKRRREALKVKRKRENRRLSRRVV